MLKPLILQIDGRHCVLFHPLCHNMLRLFSILISEATNQGFLIMQVLYNKLWTSLFRTRIYEIKPYSGKIRKPQLNTA